jgi:hypothetical protein
VQPPTLLVQLRSWYRSRTTTTRAWYRPDGCADVGAGKRNSGIALLSAYAAGAGGRVWSAIGAVSTSAAQTGSFELMQLEPGVGCGNSAGIVRACSRTGVASAFPSVGGRLCLCRRYTSSFAGCWPCWCCSPGAIVRRSSRSWCSGIQAPRRDVRPRR